MALGSNIKRLREARGWTQAALAKIAGLDDKGQQAIAALEKRDSRSSALAPAIAAALGVSVDELIGSVDVVNKMEADVLNVLRSDGWEVTRLHPRSPNLDLPVEFTINGQKHCPDMKISKGSLTTYIEVKSPYLRHDSPWELLEQTGKVGIITSFNPDEIRMQLAQHLTRAGLGHNNVEIAAPGTNRVPVISHVQAGAMTEVVDPYAIGAADKYLLTDQDVSDSAFALILKGRSMEPDFHDGDAVIIDPAVQPIPGDFVAAKNGEHEATFKKYRPRGVNEHGQEVFELVPLNNDFPTMRSDVTPIRIIGTMVEHRRFRRR